MSLRKPFIIVGDRTKPTCGRSDCDPAENPTHWTDTELTPQAKAALRLFPDMVIMLREMKPFVEYYHEREGAPHTTRKLKALLKRIERVQSLVQTGGAK